VGSEAAGLISLGLKRYAVLLEEPLWLKKYVFLLEEPLWLKRYVVLLEEPLWLKRFAVKLEEPLWWLLPQLLVYPIHVGCWCCEMLSRCGTQRQWGYG